MITVSRRALTIIFIYLISFLLYFLSIPLAGQFNLFSLFFLVVVSAYLIRCVERSWVFFLYFFALLFAVSSSILAEYTSAYMLEIKEYAYSTGGGARNAFLMAIFLCGIFISFNFVVKCCPSYFRKVVWGELFLLKVFLCLAWLLLGYMLAVIFIYGSPLFMGVDRFSYWANIAPPGYRYVTSLVPTFGFIVSYAREIGRLRNFFALVWLLGVFVLLVLGGEKFSGLLVLGFFYLLPYFSVHGRRLSIRLLSLVSLVFIVIVGGVLLNYYLIYGSAFLTIFEARLVLQGQMLFALDAISSSDLVQAQSSWSNFIGLGDGVNGIRYLMYQIAPVEVVEGYISGGATFTSPFPANLSYFFGLYGAPWVLNFFSLLVGVCGGILYAALRRQAFLLSLLSLKAFFYIYLAVVMGEAQAIFDWKMAFYLLMVVALILLSIRQVNSDER